MATPVWLKPLPYRKFKLVLSVVPSAKSSISV
jgi:hypothetical protein